MSGGALQEKRDYTQRAYTPEMVSEAISVFMASGGSLKTTKGILISKWGFSPTEPTLRKWLTSSNEAMNLLDERTSWNLQNNIAEVMELSYDRLIKALENDEIPPAKIGTLYGIMIDKWLLMNKIRNDIAKKRGDDGNDIIGDELLSDKKELMEALINENIGLD